MGVAQEGMEVQQEAASSMTLFLGPSLPSLFFSTKTHFATI